MNVTPIAVFGVAGRCEFLDGVAVHAHDPVAGFDYGLRCDSVGFVVGQLQRERVLVTTLTKRMAEELNDYLARFDISTAYMHSDVKTLDRISILDDLFLRDTSPPYMARICGTVTWLSSMMVRKSLGK